MRRAMRIACAVAVGVLAGACAHGTPPPLHSTRLVVHRTGSGGVRPFVRAKVAGQPMDLLLDTGAIRSILPSKFAQANHLAMRWSRESDERVVDSNGKLWQMPTLPDVPVQFEGEASAGTIDFLMNPSRDTEGILAPQDLLRSGWVLVIDIGREELRYEPEEGALKRLAAETSAPLREIDFHRCLTEGFFERSHRIVSATINGVSANLLVDTGASLTVLTRNNPAIPSLLSRRGDLGTNRAVASMGSGYLLQDVPVVVLETSFVLPVLVLPESPVCGHGALGADVLRRCTLLWGWSSMWAACRAPAEGR